MLATLFNSFCFEKLLKLLSQAGAIAGFANGGQLMGLYGCSCMQVLAYHTATSEQMVAFVETGGKETSTARQ
jgi:hypothetical protein